MFKLWSNVIFFATREQHDPGEIEHGRFIVSRTQEIQNMIKFPIHWPTSAMWCMHLSPW